MFDRFERHHRIHGCIVERQVPRIALEEPEIRLAVSLGGVRDRLGRDFDTDDRTSRLRQQRSAVSLSRRDIKHVSATTERARQKIAMQMLDLDLPGCGSGQTLPGPFQRCVWNDPPKDLTQVFEFLHAEARNRHRLGDRSYRTRPFGRSLSRALKSRPAAQGPEGTSHFLLEGQSRRPVGRRTVRPAAAEHRPKA